MSNSLVAVVIDCAGALTLDLISDTFEAETERPLSLGALRLRDVQADKSRWTTFADIEGNEFDLIAG